VAAQDVKLIRDPTGKSLLIREYLSSPSRRNKFLDHFRKTEVWFAHPASMQRALWPIVTEREAGMRWTRRSRQTNVVFCGRRSRVVLTSMPFFSGKTHIRRAKAPQKAPFHGLKHLPVSSRAQCPLQNSQQLTYASPRLPII